MQPTLCSRCHKNVAVIFIQKIEGGETKSEGLCLKCARELGIKPVEDMMKKMGITDEDLDGLTKVYGKRGAATRALDGVDLSLEAGEYVGIMGASGSGKTTLLNCVSTIDKPTSGSILVEGRELTRLKGRELTRFRRERLGFIFQDCNLLDTLTAFENIALALTILAFLYYLWLYMSVLGKKK